MTKKTIVTKWYVRKQAKNARESLDVEESKEYTRTYRRGLEARRRNRGRHPRLYAPSVGRTGRRKDIR